MKMFRILTVTVLLILGIVTGFPLSETSWDCWETNTVPEGPDRDIAHLSQTNYNRPDAETGRRVEAWNETSEENPEELGAYTEGDMVFPKTGIIGLADTDYRWPKAIVPYEIKGNFSSQDLNIINQAIDAYNTYTCVKFRPRTAKDTDYVSIVNDKTGCWSNIGRIRGRQVVNLQSRSCTTRLGTPIHELMHSIGFLHEHSRPDRDTHVRVLWDNIKDGRFRNFVRAPRKRVQDFGVKYDYVSVMHYSRTSFSKNRLPTLMTKDRKYEFVIGQRRGFSKSDILKVNTMYNCKNKPRQMANPTGIIPEESLDNKTYSDSLMSAHPELFGIFN